MNCCKPKETTTLVERSHKGGLDEQGSNVMPMSVIGGRHSGTTSIQYNINIHLTHTMLILYPSEFCLHKYSSFSNINKDPRTGRTADFTFKINPEINSAECSNTVYAFLTQLCSLANISINVHRLID